MPAARAAARPRRPIDYQGQRQQAARLIGVRGPPRRAAQFLGREVGSRNCHCHIHSPSANQSLKRITSAPSWESISESAVQSVGMTYFIAINFDIVADLNLPERTQGRPSPSTTVHAPVDQAFPAHRRTTRGRPHPPSRHPRFWDRFPPIPKFGKTVSSLCAASIARDRNPRRW